ncbi:hypothetical protein NSS79_27275 [Paenibacillus sp. FSL L8-0436]|uniref:hypothetical protein n=1 Tax=Paenibacillus sp. FSL L8-0436 TaxID=2954686 RepID=UPI003158311C
MQSQANLSATESGYLAGSNNLGYLIAAFGACCCCYNIAIRCSHFKSKRNDRKFELCSYSS